MNIKELTKKMDLYNKSGFINEINDIAKLDIPAYIKRGLHILQPDAFYFDNYEEVNNPVFLLFYKDIKINLYSKRVLNSAFSVIYLLILIIKFTFKIFSAKASYVRSPVVH